MKLCSECKEPLGGELGFSEDGQEDFPWCGKCLDYVGEVESGVSATERSAIDSHGKLSNFDLTYKIANALILVWHEATNDLVFDTILEVLNQERQE